MDKATITFIWLIIMVVIVANMPTDTTDRGFFQRSGMELHYDAMTGCHYLGTFLGGVTPRLNQAGEHICTTQED